jgi:hypothetical protein
MSIFSLFGNKASRSSDRLPEQSALDDEGASQPTPSGSDRKSLRLTQRELLYGAVKDVMIRSGVLAASYRFKVLSLDSQGRQYLIMVDLLRHGIGELKDLAKIESLIVQAAKVRHDLVVTGVYWRNELPDLVRNLPSMPDHPALAGLSSSAERGGAPSSLNEKRPLRGKIESPQQHGNNKESGKSAPPERLTLGRKPRVSSPDFEDTRLIAPNESGSPLSATQYGDLN